MELQEENQGTRDALSDARSQLWRVGLNSGETLHSIRELTARQEQLEARAVNAQAEVDRTLSGVSEVKTLADEILREVGETHTTVLTMADQILDIWKYLEPYMNPRAQAIPGDTVAGVLKNDGQRMMLILIVMGIGTLLGVLHIGGQTLTMGFTLLALMVAIGLGYLRANPLRKNAVPDTTGRSPRFGDLLFVSFFVVLSAPLLESARTGVDV